MSRRLCARLSFALLVAPFALFATTDGAAASGAGECDGDHVVVVNDRVDSLAGTSSPQVTVALPSALAPGRYRVTVATSDGYEGRAGLSQENEQVVLRLGATQWGPTPDLADDVDFASNIAEGEIELLESVTAVTVAHALADTLDHNSVSIDCLSFTALGDGSPPQPPPPATPPTAVCAGDHTITIASRLDSRGSLPRSTRASFATAVPAGRYDVVVVTSDGYEGRAATNQLYEQVVISFGDTTFTPTADLPDDVDDATLTTRGQIELTTAATEVVAAHVLANSADHNSVWIDCVGLTAAGPPPPPPPPAVEVSLTHTCDLAVSVVVELVNGGGATTAVIAIDGVLTEVALPADDRVSIVVAAEPGVRSVVVDVAGSTVFDADYDVACDGDGGGDGGDAPGDGGGDAPGDGGGDGGDAPGDGGGDGGDAPGDLGRTDTPDVLAPLGFVPELAIGIECGKQTIEASVLNAGDAPGAVTVAIAPSARAAVARVAVGETTVVSLPLPEGSEGSRTEVVLVTADGIVLTESLDVDCLAAAAPVASVMIDCAAGTVSIVIENTGGERVAVRAFAEQVALLGSDTLAAGEQTVFETPILAAEVPVRVVSVDGQDILRTDVAHGCREDDVEVGLSLTCPAAEVGLRLTNPAAENRLVTLNSGEGPIPVEIPGGETVLLSRSLDSTPSLLVLSRFGDILLDESLADWSCEAAEGPTAGCESAAPPAEGWVVADDTEPVVCTGIEARLVLDCVTGVGVVELRNGTLRRVTVTISADGVAVTEASVEANRPATVGVDDAPGTRVTVDLGTERLLDTAADCRVEPDRTAAVISALLIALMSIVAAVVARFDPWLRV